MISGYGLFLLGESLMMKRKKAYGECMAAGKRKGFERKRGKTKMRGRGG